MNIFFIAVKLTMHAETTLQPQIQQLCTDRLFNQGKSNFVTFVQSDRTFFLPIEGKAPHCYCSTNQRCHYSDYLSYLLLFDQCGI